MIMIKRSHQFFFFFLHLTKCQDILGKIDMFIHTFNKYRISLADYIKLERKEI